MTGRPYGIYIHIPFCKAKCKYCAFVSTPDFSLQKAYVRALIDEIKSYGNSGIKADTVYIGGGTPSCLFRGGISDIMSAVKDSFSISDNAEITVECNPESVDGEFIEECVKSGVNRVSMGLQSSDDCVLKAVGRIHTYSDYISAVKLLSGYFDNISSDIILGLPNQTKRDIKRSVETIAEYCRHASVYALSVEDGTPLKCDNYNPSDDYVAELYDYSVELLTSYGFNRYEVSNFAKGKSFSRHNLKYWRCEPYLGFGVAAHGYDGDSVRYAHSDSIKEYIADSTPTRYELTDKDKYNEYVMLALRTENGVDVNDFKRRFGYSFVERNLKSIERMQKNGSICVSDSSVRIAPEYMFVMNGIIEDLMLD